MLPSSSLLRFAAVLGFLATAAAPAFAQTKPAAPTATAATLKDGAFRRGGKVFRLRGGQATPLATPLRFSNGLTLQPNGTLVSKNGSRRQLAEGKAINMQGDVVIFRDDMMTPEYIEQHDEVTTGAKPTVVEIPAATNLAALNEELQRTAQRFEQLRQLSDLLAERAATPAKPGLDQQVQALSRQLQP